MDAALDSDGDLSDGFDRLTDPLAAIAQRIKIRLEGHRGSWPYDTGAGMPYDAWRQQKPTRPQEIAAALRREILATEGVLRIDDWETALNTEARSLSVSCTVIATDGAIGLEFVPIGASDGNHFPSLRLFPTAAPIAGL